MATTDQKSLRRPHVALEIESPIAGLRLHGVRGRERIGECFLYRLELHAARDRNVDIEEMLATHVTITLDVSGQPPKRLQGLVSKVARVGRTSVNECFEATLVPRHYLLSEHAQAGYRVHQERTLQQIIAAEFAGFSCRVDQVGPRPPREFSVRYAESPWHYVQRLLSEEGCYCYFDHREGKTELVVAESSRLAPLLPSCDDLLLGSRPDRPSIMSWEVQQSLVPGKARVLDYHCEKSAAMLTADASAPASIGLGSEEAIFGQSIMGSCEVTTHEEVAHRFMGLGKGGGPRPEGLVGMEDQVQRHAKIDIERECARALEAKGVSDCASLRPGYLFRLTQAGGHSGEYFVTEVDHRVRLPFEADDDRSAKPYRCRFRAIPRDLPYRMTVSRPRPRIRGVMTAAVVDVADVSSTTTDDARVKVALRFDRREDPESCWLRVAQPLAGRGQGVVELPRRGEEVIVTFLRGDPDRPVAIGSVYNASHLPPVAREAMHETEGIWRPSRHRSPERRNHLSFRTRRGAEEVSWHTDGDMATSTERNHEIATGGNLVLQVGSTSTDGSSSAEAGGDGAMEVDEVMGGTESAGDGNYRLMVKGDSKLSVGGDSNITVHGTACLEAERPVLCQFLMPTVAMLPSSLTSVAGNALFAHGASVGVHLPLGWVASGKLDVTVAACDLELNVTAYDVKNFNGVACCITSTETANGNVSYGALCAESKFVSDCKSHLQRKMIASFYRQQHESLTLDQNTVAGAHAAQGASYQQ
ncbi:Phage-related baseplate assembly protein [Planctomycetes bacterium Pan216]|uniref:Phage-related baseplate assembly protein n=1 Tax=Kolteria novifilia TaxID=2527975 RepID=A0A518AZK2_9BACT|nr:Phage-related baseplate assembly protein [Planctomycetes bacterium Pan216]